MAWKIYFWLVAAFLYLSQEATLAGGVTLTDFLAILVEVTALVGLFAYVYRRRLATPRFWRGWVVLYSLQLLMLGARDLWLSEIDVVAFLLGLLVRLPMLAGIYRGSLLSRSRPRAAAASPDR